MRIEIDNGLIQIDGFVTELMENGDLSSRLTFALMGSTIKYCPWCVQEIELVNEEKQDEN